MSCIETKSSTNKLEKKAFNAITWSSENCMPFSSMQALITCCSSRCWIKPSPITSPSTSTIQTSFDLCENLNILHESFIVMLRRRRNYSLHAQLCDLKALSYCLPSISYTLNRNLILSSGDWPANWCMASMNSCSEMEPELSLSNIWNTRFVKNGWNGNCRTKNRTILVERRNAIASIADAAKEQVRNGDRAGAHIFRRDDIFEVFPSDLLFIAHGFAEQLLQALQWAFVEASPWPNRFETVHRNKRYTNRNFSSKFDFCKSLIS